MNLKRSESAHKAAVNKKITDSNSSLHLIQPDCGFPYESPSAESIEDRLDRMLVFLDRETPAGLVNQTAGDPIKDFSNITRSSQFEPGAFRVISYEMGMLYAGMLKASVVLNKKKFADYAFRRLDLIAEICPWFKGLEDQNPEYSSPVHSVLHPESLDDAGTMAAALIMADKMRKNSAYSPLTDNYTNFVCNKQFRLSDGSFARNRPYARTLWIDDLYMSVSLLSQLGLTTGDNMYFDEAVKQVMLFSDKMFNRELGLFAHGWGQNAPYRSKFYWGRANGWALMAMAELLDTFPESGKNRNTILDLFISHLRGIAAVQSGSGLWHQLLNKIDSYTESSASAIIIYCMAKAINRGFVSAKDFGPAAVLGWNALAERINKEGHIEGICVGTGMGFEPVFYYNRPVSIYAAHGYGPTIMAGTEILQLIRNHNLINYDGALVFDYTKID